MNGRCLGQYLRGKHSKILGYDGKDGKDAEAESCGDYHVGTVPRAAAEQEDMEEGDTTFTVATALKSGTAEEKQRDPGKRMQWRTS